MYTVIPNYRVTYISACGKFLILNFVFLLCLISTYAQNLTLQLTPSNYNDYNISCFGGRDGAINLTITGGTPPYTILWSTRDTVEDLSGLASGYYRVEVSGANPSSTPVSAEITLREPEALNIMLNASIFTVNSRDYNISLAGACNGSINTVITGGVTPYAYSWSPSGSTSAGINSLCAIEYKVIVTDYNGCTHHAVKLMTEPPRDDWTMNGNYGSNPNSDFIGTSDLKDFVFRTNNTERIRIKDNGGIKLSSLAGSGEGIITTDANGVLNRVAISFAQPQNCPDDPTFAWRHRQQSPQSVYTCWERVGINTSFPRENLQIGELFTFHSGGSKVISYNSFYDSSPGIEKRRRMASGPVSTLHFHNDGSVEIQSLASAGSAGDYLEGGSALISRLKITDDGKIGIGKTSPSYKLDVDGEINAAGLMINGNAINLIWQKTTGSNDIYYGQGKVGIGTTEPKEAFQIGNLFTIHDGGSKVIGYNHRWQGGSSYRLDPSKPVTTIGFSEDGSINFEGAPALPGNTVIGQMQSFLKINNDGYIGMGVEPDANWRLKVCGKVKATEFEINTGWCDFVFEEGYKRMTFEEQAIYYKENRKLPYIESGKQIEAEGLKVGNTMQGFVRNLEETRLDVVELYKMITELKADNERLKKEVETIKRSK